MMGMWYMYPRVPIGGNNRNSQQRCFEVQQINTSQSFPSFSTALRQEISDDMGGSIVLQSAVLVRLIQDQSLLEQRPGGRPWQATSPSHQSAPNFAVPAHLFVLNC